MHLEPSTNALNLLKPTCLRTKIEQKVPPWRPTTFRWQAQRQEHHLPRARTQLRLARTHATHERIEIEVEIEIDFPVQGVLTELTPLNLRYIYIYIYIYIYTEI